MMNQSTASPNLATDSTEINHQHSLEIKHIFDQLEKLNDISIALSYEHDANQLLEKILLGAISLTNADGGTIYSVENNLIKFEVVYSSSLGIHLNNMKGVPINLPSVPLFDKNASPNFKNVVSYSYHKNQTINIENVYDTEGFDFSGTRLFDEKNNYHSVSFLTVPLKNHRFETIGMLQLINALDPKTQKIVSFDAVAQHFCESLATQASTVLTKQELIVDIEQLFSLMVILIFNAVEL